MLEFAQSSECGWVWVIALAAVLLGYLVHSIQHDRQTTELTAKLLKKHIEVVRLKMFLRSNKLLDKYNEENDGET